MNNINLYHLKYFLDAAQEGGISQSARKNFVTQSAVSRAISSLEQDLGVELIVHQKNHFQLTEAGESILEKGRAIFDLLSHLQETASGHLQSLRGPLRFGCNQAILSKLIAPALTRMESQYPEIEPKIKLGNTDQIQLLLNNREIDFGIVVDDGEVETHFKKIKIFSDKLLVVKSPKFQKDPFKNLIVSRTKKGGLSQKFFGEYKRVFGKTLTPKTVVASWQVITDMAIAGYGASVVPSFICKEAVKTKKLEVVKTKVRSIPFDLCTIVLRNRSLPKNARPLLEAITNY